MRFIFLLSQRLRFILQKKFTLSRVEDYQTGFGFDGLTNVHSGSAITTFGRIYEFSKVWAETEKGVFTCWATEASEARYHYEQAEAKYLCNPEYRCTFTSCQNISHASWISFTSRMIPKSFVLCCSHVRKCTIFTSNRSYCESFLLHSNAHCTKNRQICWNVVPTEKYYLLGYNGVQSVES
jgi:hypothetical protein